MIENTQAKSESQFVIVRDDAMSLIANLPIDCTIEEIIEELEIYAMIQRGLTDSDAGRSISSTEMRRRIESWGK